MPLAPKASIDLAINYIGNNLKSASAYLLLNGKKQASIVADTLVFKLNANIDELTPAVRKFLNKILVEYFWNIFIYKLNCRKIEKNR